MKLMHAALACFCVGLPPPSGAMAMAMQAPWEASPAPFVLHGEQVVIDEDRQVVGRVILADHSALDVAAGRTLTLMGAVDSDITGPVNPHDPDATRSLFKLGEGHLALHADSSRGGGTLLLRGSLGVAADGALGADTNTLTLVAGTRLELADGVRLAQSLRVRRDDPVDLLDSRWTLTAAHSEEPVTWRVAAGEATLAGHIDATAPIVKDGAGTLRLTEFNQSANGDPLVVLGGGLRVDGLWLRGPIHTESGTVLSGNGYIHEAQVAGHLQPGSPDAVGTLMFDQGLRLAPTAQTRIRIDATGGADALQTWDTMQLAGDLRVEPTPGAWTPQTRWVIAQADAGFGPADASAFAMMAPDASAAVVPDSIGMSALAGSRFATAASTIRYLDPVLTYEPTRVLLGLRFNSRGLNTVDGAWRSALIEDSRFVRESALAHAASGRAWAQTWAANAERPAADGWPSDDRDTAGLQIGISHRMGSSADWFLSAFAGAQTTDLSSQYDSTAARHGARDTATHVGLGSSHGWRGLRLTVGAAHAWHHAQLHRQADPAEADLRTRSQAQLTQAWIDLRPDLPLAMRDWGVTPYTRLAWLRLHRPGLQESGSLAAVSLSPQTDQRWVSHLGVQIQRQWSTEHGPAVLAADVGVQSHWGNRSLNSRQAYNADPDRWFDVASPPLARHSLRLDIGVHAPVTRHARLKLAYTGQYGAQQRQHGVWLGVSIAI
ncbi:MAG: autotransporter outer membrane beta-barrel domain-containing protein [Castellaniella sp.]|uniref:autotransporter outer membrane beta-barrel domain-containing protein n=1 Tax=Castellaniella sp. TaxID=1955812 RepID=UPI00121A9B90|nr:autotransporter outer membrane beta-barrel domain-containing protein [Castellaniella sp.]TAN25451.1 MAG: autotransporter outer membrane beta-barrel domain-containing protein [Castellaniella sp.]